MRDLTGTPVSTYYRGASQGPPVNGTPVTASATGSLSQSAGGSVSIGAHPGVWLVVGVAAVFLLLHHGRIDGGE